MTKGGLPLGRTTLVEGGAGSGKTVACLQILTHAVKQLGKSAVMVACEERGPRILRNSRSFGWGVEDLPSEQFYMMDARPSPDTAFVGDFDLSGLLAALSSKVEKMGAQLVAFDSLDFILAFLKNPGCVRREFYRLHEWLQEHEVTALITLKSDLKGSYDSEFAQFMVDCVLNLEHQLIDGISHRFLRIRKYRGSSFEENRRPILIGAEGLEVSQTAIETPLEPASVERFSSGVPALDRMLAGGYFRHTSTLLTGAPGTAKTSLCGAFAEAACNREEKTLFIGYDTRGEEVVRNLASIGVDLAPHLKSGLLRLEWTQAFHGSAEFQLMEIRRLAEQHQAENLIIDPLSALQRSGMERASVERMVSWSRSRKITLLCTSLLENRTDHLESTPIDISTLADNWIHLSYHVHAGERNRGLSIVKARGTAHSNQVRELILTDSGITLADVYTSGGEVLMGTLRHEKETELQLAEESRELEAENERRRIQSELAALQAKVDAKIAEQKALEITLNQASRKKQTMKREMYRSRGGHTD